MQLSARVSIFAKLPKGDSWSADLQHYSKAISPTPDIYLFAREGAQVFDWHQSILVPKSHSMPGEYFLLAVSDTVSFLIRGQRAEASLPTDGEEEVNVNSAGGETEKIPVVQYQITFQKPLIQKFIDDLRPLTEASLATYPEQRSVAVVLQNWSTQLQLPDQCYAGLIDALVLQEGLHQERLQHQARTYRRQAMTASNLSTQNESLLNTLRVKDDFLSTIGQELRTPLSAIKTALPLLSSPNLKPPQRQRYLDMISRECDRQVNLINGVLELLQIERSMITANPNPVNLFDVLPGVVSTYQPIAQEKGIRLAYTVPNTLPAICCPENWVRQIVIHLLSNSIQYTDSGGEVWVTAQPADDDMLMISVKDTGVGIPQNELPHVFDHFYRGRQTNPQDDSVGLGLSIVQQLLLYCGGNISVESQPNIGTDFTVQLPISQTA
ncbi:MAG: sensor histidine kinase [Leptolyngbyaceae cyanobacterium]